MAEDSNPRIEHKHSVHQEACKQTSVPLVEVEDVRNLANAQKLGRPFATPWAAEEEAGLQGMYLFACPRAAAR